MDITAIAVVNIVLNIFTILLPLGIFIAKIYRELGEVKTDLKNLKERK